MAQQKPKPKLTREPTKHDTKKKPISILPKNEAQEKYVKALHSACQMVVFGPSGTGKTYVVSTVAASLYHTKDIDKIVITRPHVAVGERLGFLPGDLREKCEPWALPVLDVLDQHLGKGVVSTGIKNGNIEIAPMALMRGRSFSNCFIICDEAQNITFHELKMLLTRVGEGSKLVLNGDIMQSDLKEADGLSQIVRIIKKHDLPVPIVEFGVEDIVRSDHTKMWVKTFIKEGV
jgi:phosphate starvation-inducible PhoH-like protein|tara:strand:- start:3534 stop:4232 length:699 start_codon:yes stop_codon:yes gene_type:complete